MSNRDECEGEHLTRRELISRLLAGMSAGIALPLVGATHPVYEHFRNVATITLAQAARDASHWAPLFLSPRQRDTLMTLAEAIVPGATKARAGQFIDLLLSVDSKTNQEGFVESLSVIEGAGQERFGRSLQTVRPSELEALLTDLSQAEAQRDHFNNLKEWISVAYYSSEEGMRELGWKGQHAFATFPGCEHTEGSH